TTYNIEDITRHFGGFVTYTNLTSNVDAKTNILVSRDSSLETTYYTVSNYMQIRVPNTNLDSTLKAITPLIDYLDYRIIKANDIALQLLSNQLTQNRMIKHEQRLTNALDVHGKKLIETTDAENNLLNKQEQSDNAKISNLSMMDQVKFSTITLNIYQRQTIKREVILNDKDITTYEPGFLSQILDSLKFGWQILEAIIITIAKLWGLILLGVIGFIAIKKLNERLRKK
ncbi:MAG: hypothetical protein JWO06_1523, partial [Bacteroidota bacterium]|nr:hypothetical protein [Bacteroidota bacterium]